MVRSATGRNLEELNWQSWDVSDLKGKSAQIVVTDTATGPWGHILLDEVRASDTKASPFADNTSVNLVVDGKVVASATGNNSGTLEWTSMDVSAYKGRKARLVIEDHNGNAEGLGSPHGRPDPPVRHEGLLRGRRRPAPGLRQGLLRGRHLGQRPQRQAATRWVG